MYSANGIEQKDDHSETGLSRLFQQQVGGCLDQIHIADGW